MGDPTARDKIAAIINDALLEYERILRKAFAGHIAALEAERTSPNVGLVERLNEAAIWLRKIGASPRREPTEEELREVLAWAYKKVGNTKAKTPMPASAMSIVGAFDEIAFAAMSEAVRRFSAPVEVTEKMDKFRKALEKIADLIDSEAGEPLDIAIETACKAIGRTYEA